jgi:hypothetical protein
MNMAYDDKLNQAAEDYPLLQQATRQLEEMLGPSAESVSAVWEGSRDAQDQPLYKLTISDPTDEAQRTFTPIALRDPDLLRFNLGVLIGALMLAHLDRQVNKLQQMVAQGD